MSDAALKPETTAVSRPARVPSHGRGALRPFVPGQSGNPGGVAGRYQETQRLARDASPEMTRILIALANDETEDSRVRVVAANSVLDRAFGKPREIKPGDADADAREHLAPDYTCLTDTELLTLRALFAKATAASIIPDSASLAENGGVHEADCDAER
jgi:hypothetical protein